MLIRTTARWLCRLEAPLVSLAALSAIASARFLPAALLAAGLFWPLRWLAVGRLTRAAPLNLPAGLLALLGLAGLWLAPLGELALPQTLRLWLGIAWYFAILNWTTEPGRWRAAAAGVLIAAAGLAGFALIGVDWDPAKLAVFPAAIYGRLQVWVQDAANPNVIAGFFALFLPLPAALSLFLRPARHKALWPAAAGLSLVLLALAALTQSRGAWLALALSLPFLAALRWRMGWLALAAAVGLLLAGLAWLGWPRAVEIALGSSLLGGAQGRLEVWQRAVFIIQDYPLTGIGLGGFGPVVDLAYPFRTLAPGSVPHAHNLFLQIAVDLGLPGLAAWLACWALSFLLAGHMFRAAQPGRTAPAELDLARGLAAGLLASNLALGLHGLTDAVVWGMVRPAPLVWALWGLCAAGWVAWRGPAQPPA